MVMQTVGIIKDRSRQLAPLSIEHREGLEFANRIREGLKRNAPVEIMREYILWYWRNHIRPHFRHEEDVVFSFFPPGNKLAQRMRNEHDMICELLICLDEEADKRTLTLFADLIVDHISFEEKELFAWLEKELSEDQLEKIQARLEETPIVCAEKWENEFWNKPLKQFVDCWCN
jgi:hemerythrin-like domain-containing protein